MEPVQPHEEDANASPMGDDQKRVGPSDGLLKCLCVGTVVVTVIVVIFTAMSSSVVREAILLGGYLNSIPRVMERRDAYLSNTDAFYSRDFTVRGEIAALLYDNTEGANLLERVSAAKETIGAVGIALVDREGNVLVDTEAPASQEASNTASASPEAPAKGEEPPSDQQGSGDAGAQAGLDDEELDQVINSKDDLVIIGDDTGDAAVTLTVSAGEGEQDQSLAEEPEPQAAEGDGAQPEEARDDKAGQAGEEPAADAPDDSERDGDEAIGDEQGAQVPLKWNSATQTEDEAAPDGEAPDSPNVYVYYRAKVSDGSTLIIKFDPTTSLSVNQEEGQWENLLDRLVTGIDAYAFVREDETGTWTCYPITSVSGEELKALEQGLSVVDEKVTFSIPFAESKGLVGVRFGVMDLKGKPFLVDLRAFPDKGLTFVMAIPFSRFLPGPTRSCIMVVAFVLLSIFLLIRYIRVCIAGTSSEERPEVLADRIRKQCHVGLAIVVFSLSITYIMSIMLGKSAITATTTRTQRESLTYELDHHEEIVDKVLKEYSEASVTQAKALARLLSEQPQLRTRSGLKRLADVVGARYLMLFDKSGRELFSSNSYIGFKVDTDEELSVESIVDAPGLQAVLLGETCVVSDPIEDREGVKYHVIGALVTNEDGLPDGFLAMATDDQQVDATYKDDLSPLMNRERQIAMIVDDETGTILKHSDVSKVGDPVKAYLREDVLGRSYEGYTWYDNDYVYMSSDTDQGISTIVLSDNSIGAEEVVSLLALIAIDNALICLVFYPLAVRYCCSSKRALRATRLGNPLSVFLYGYSAFFCTLSIVALISSKRGNWPAFSAVFEGKWSRGINQFSLWSALFFTTQAMTLLYVSRRLLLRRTTDSSSTVSRTLLRLSDSLVTYVVVIAVVLVDLTWFGVDTTALIASAGIVSIAVGMGAKDLIADILAGMFIIFESSVHVGDIVEIGSWRGTVTDMGIRTCEITDRNNNVKVVNNSHINELVNFSRKMTSCTLEFEIGRDVALEDVPTVVGGYIDEIVSKVPDISSTLHYVGITGITDSTYKVTLGWSCDESKREGLTFRLNNAVRLILERARRQKEKEKEKEREKEREREAESHKEWKADHK